MIARDVQALDRYEGVPGYYHRITVFVRDDRGRVRRAFAYKMGNGFGETAPALSYVQIIHRGCRDWGIEPDAEVESKAKDACRVAVAPYRDACRKAGVECEFAGAKAPPVAPRVRFLVERVKGGIKVAIKGKPKTEEIIPDATLRKSVGRAAFDYCERALGPVSQYGNKHAGLGQRFRVLLAK